MRPLSPRNPRLQGLARLVRRRGERDEQRAFVIEGPTLLAAALQAGVHLRDVFVEDDALARAPLAGVISHPDIPEPWVVPAGTLDRVGDVTTSQGVLAIAHRPEATWPEPASHPFLLVLAELSDPGNLGTLFRAGAAAGADAVVVLGGADPWSPKVVRSSACACFHLPVVTGEARPESLLRLRASGYTTVATQVRGSEAYDAADLTGPVAVVLGNEAHGLAPALASAASTSVTIPMAGPTESLNVAMAGTILAFEVLRQRRRTAAGDAARS